MTFPSNLTTIAVSGTYTDIAGRPESGTVTFEPSEDLIDAAGTVVFTKNPVVLRLDQQGRFYVSLPATDNTGLSPNPFTYSVSENISGRNNAYIVSLPSSLGTSVDISALRP